MVKNVSQFQQTKLSKLLEEPEGLEQSMKLALSLRIIRLTPYGNFKFSMFRFQKEDIAILRRCINTPNELSGAAGLLPTTDHVVNLSYLFPGLSFPEIIVHGKFRRLASACI